jgi:integrase
LSRKKRGNGEGNIYRRKDGLWVGQYRIGSDEGPKTRYVYSKKRAEVAKRLASAIAERDKGLVCDSQSLTLEGYLSGWLESVEGTIGPRTYERYEQSCRLQINPLLGRTRLDGLKAVQLQGLYRKKQDSGLSPRTVQIIHATLHKALDQGVKWRLIPANVAKSATPPRVRNKEIRPLNQDQARKLWESARERTRSPVRPRHHHGDEAGRTPRPEVGRCRSRTGDPRGQQDHS